MCIMNKKLVNDPERAVDEALAGLVAVHPGLVLLEGHRVVVRADINLLVATNKVWMLRSACTQRRQLTPVLTTGDAAFGGRKWP